MAPITTQIYISTKFRVERNGLKVRVWVDDQLRDKLKLHPSCILDFPCEVTAGHYYDMAVERLKEIHGRV